MIQANQLRIGNWILKDGKYFQIIYGINKKYVYGLDSEILDSHINKSELNNLHPIPLTEEILLKCGFDNGYEITIKIGRKKIVFNWSIKIVSTGYRSGWYCEKYRNIKYLHQLQNLIFALTGKELEINL